MKRSLLLIFFLSLPVFSCKALFWRDTKSALQTRWQDSRTAFEPVLHFESKASLLPWHGNALTRDYATEILRHQLFGTKWKTRSLGTIDGWVLEGSLFAVGQRLVFLRGNNDNLGTLPDREVVLASTESIEEELIFLKSKRLILLAIPSPDGRKLVVFTTNSTTERPGSDLYAEFYDIATNPKSPTRLAETPAEWNGVPGMPLAAWSKDGSQVYLHRGSDVLSITKEGARKAAQFPKCFVATRFSGETSPEGERLFRDPEAGFADGLPKLRLKKGSPVLPFGSGPTIRDASQVSPSCEK